MTIYFTKDHEWISVEGSTATVGITNHAQEQLGDIVFVDLPDLGAQVQQGEDIAVVESVKAASDIFAPIAGTVSQINEALTNNPASVNEDAEGSAWFFKLSPFDTNQIEGLMDRVAYDTFVASNDE